MGGIVLATTFAVSHNVPETKPGTPVPQSTFAGERLLESRDVRDWGIQQLVTSANWGDKVGCFFTGGLNLQIEYHMFPAVSFMHYPAISRIVGTSVRSAASNTPGTPRSLRFWGRTCASCATSAGPPTCPTARAASQRQTSPGAMLWGPSAASEEVRGRRKEGRSQHNSAELCTPAPHAHIQ